MRSTDDPPGAGGGVIKRGISVSISCLILCTMPKKILWVPGFSIEVGLPGYVKKVHTCPQHQNELHAAKKIAPLDVLR